MLRRAVSQAPSTSRLLRRTFVLDAHAQELDKTIQFNPEWTPGGDEGGVDTNSLPWLPVSTTNSIPDVIRLKQI